jgi:hypothetical protein
VGIKEGEKEESCLEGDDMDERRGFDGEEKVDDLIIGVEWGRREEVCEGWIEDFFESEIFS